MKFKKIITGSLLTVFLVTGASVPTTAVQAQTMDTEEHMSLQWKLLDVLQRLIALLTGQPHDAMMKDDMMSDSMMKDGTYTLTLNSTLADLTEGNYEGWLIVGDEKISTGLFTGGDTQTMNFDTAIETIDKIVVTIEPEDDADPGPSGIVVLAGAVADGQADLSFPIDFSDAAGSAILATPTDGADNNETSGIWFLSVPGPAESLSLPELPTGWVYEGWAVHDGTPLTSGRFTATDEADDFDGFSGTVAAGPNYPGEDFIQNAPAGVEFPIDLANGESKIVISVEPDIDGTDPTGTGPAQVKPLLVEIPEGQGDHENITLGLNLNSVPSGTASLK